MMDGDEVRRLAIFAVLLALAVSGCIGQEQGLQAEFASTANSTEPALQQKMQTAEETGSGQDGLVGLADAMSDGGPYECAKDGNFSKNALKIMGKKIWGTLEYEGYGMDAIYLPAKGEFYIAGAEGIWTKIGSMELGAAGPAQEMGAEQDANGSLEQFSLIFGDEAGYLCRKGMFGEEVFIPSGSVLDITTEMERAFGMLASAFEKTDYNISPQEYNLSQFSLNFQKIQALSRAKNATEIETGGQK